MAYLYKEKPTIAMVDSLQHAAKLLSKENGEYKYANYAKIVQDLYDWKEACNTSVIMIVQLNADGKVEGPEATVFDVDIPLKLIADPKTGERHLEASKNRNGGTVGRIFYEFVDNDKIIQFYEEDEYRVLKQGVEFSDMVIETVERYTSAFKNHENYDSFKKEFNKEVKSIYNSNEDNTMICMEVVKLVMELSTKHF